MWAPFEASSTNCGWTDYRGKFARAHQPKRVMSDLADRERSRHRFRRLAAKFPIGSPIAMTRYSWPVSISITATACARRASLTKVAEARCCHDGEAVVDLVPWVPLVPWAEYGVL